MWKTFLFFLSILKTRRSVRINSIAYIFGYKSSEEFLNVRHSEFFPEKTNEIESLYEGIYKRPCLILISSYYVSGYSLSWYYEYLWLSTYAVTNLATESRFTNPNLWMTFWKSQLIMEIKIFGTMAFILTSSWLKKYRFPKDMKYWKHNKAQIVGCLSQRLWCYY